MGIEPTFPIHLLNRTSTFVYSCQFFIGRITFGNSIVRLPIPQICAISSCSPRDCFQSAVRVRYAVLDSPSGTFTHISKSFVRAHPLASHLVISNKAVRVGYAVCVSPNRNQTDILTLLDRAHHLILFLDQQLPCSSELPSSERVEISTTRNRFTEFIFPIPIRRTAMTLINACRLISQG